MSELTQERLKEILEYSPDTGYFSWKVYRNQHAKEGDVAGYLNDNGYIRMNISGKSYQAHRVAWLYVYGYFPDLLVDHINGVRNDNRLCNLREASVRENSRNKGITSTNKSGYKGVSWEKRRNKWVVRIKTGERYMHGGYYDNVEDAATAYKNMAIKYHGEFVYGIR